VLEPKIAVGFSRNSRRRCELQTAAEMRCTNVRKRSTWTEPKSISNRTYLNLFPA